MKIDRIKDLTMSIVAEATMEDTLDYVRRGRRFKKKTDGEELKQRWAATFRLLVSDLDDRRVLGELNDLGAELQLREIELPYEAVKVQVEQLIATVRPLKRDGSGVLGKIMTRRHSPCVTSNFARSKGLTQTL
jgi:hypothetical protein